MENLATLTIISGALSLLCLLALHFTSPQFQPSWRMVSEYALGKHKWLLTLFFFCWGISSLLVSLLLCNTVNGGWAILGLLLIALSGIGAIMGGLFDVNHKWHGAAFGLGIPTHLVGTLLVAYNLVKLEGWQNHSTNILLSTHLVWISCILMGLSMMIMFSGFKKAGISWEKDAVPPDRVPDGVIALGGYANRLVVFCYIFWNIIIASIYLSIY